MNSFTTAAAEAILVTFFRLERYIHLFNKQKQIVNYITTKIHFTHIPDIKITAWDYIAFGYYIVSFIGLILQSK